jgi:ketosteroid isomerase-like protein
VTQAESNIATLRRFDQVLADVGVGLANEVLSAPDPLRTGADLVGADLIESIDPEVEVDLEQLGPTWPGSPRYHGVGGFIDFWREWLEAWDEFEFTRPRIEADGDWVVTEVLLDTRGRGSGAPVHWGFFQLWRFQEGRLVHFAMFSSWDEAIAAAREERS